MIRILPSGLSLPAMLRSDSAPIVDMLEHVEQGDQIVGAVGNAGQRRAAARRRPHGQAALRARARAASSTSSASSRPKPCSISKLWPVPQPISRMRASLRQIRLARDQGGKDLAARDDTTNGPGPARPCGRRRRGPSGLVLGVADADPLADHVERPPLGLDQDPADIFAEHAERDELQRPKNRIATISEG